MGGVVVVTVVTAHRQMWCLLCSIAGSGRLAGEAQVVTTVWCLRAQQVLKC